MEAKKTFLAAGRVEPLLQALSGPAQFLLPPTTVAHTCAFLSSNTKNPNDKQLIFDAYVVLEQNAKGMFIPWAPFSLFSRMGSSYPPHGSSHAMAGVYAKSKEHALVPWLWVHHNL